ncbi:MAG: Trp biosynthesis-associated membrane protein [Dermatophilaceae bacterium]
MIDRLTSKPMVLVLILVSASVVLISGSREWVSGSVGDVALGALTLHGRGSDIAPGALAAALVGLASAVAAAVSGRVVRVVAASSAALAAALGAGVVISILADPGGALGKLAAAGTGRKRDRRRARPSGDMGMGCAVGDARHGVRWAGRAGRSSPLERALEQV